MNTWKASFFISLFLLTLTNVYWLYITIDNGITATYQQVSYDDKNKAVSLLGSLIVKGGQDYTKKDILHLLRLSNKDAFIVDEANHINVNGVQFIFKNGKLSEVKA